jgi:endonuclease/exonuclease/phosphatase family metal-dependent hydrolase
MGVTIWNSARRYLICFAVLVGSLSTAAMAEQPFVRVMTYNIRIDTANDRPNQWKYRRDMLTSQIALLQPDIFGLQEVVINQKWDIAEAMRMDFALVGKGRDDGQDAGESSPIGSNIHRFKLIGTGTFWLSPTPTWLAYDMVQIGQRTLPKDAMLVHQERGHGSLIWVGSR